MNVNVLYPYSLMRTAEQLQAYFKLYGYERRETPLIEPADLFLTKAGDQIITHLITFERNGTQYALRPEFTASAAQIYSHYFDEHNEIVRWQFSGYVFEDDVHSNDSSAFQWNTVGAECIGIRGVEADAEIMALSVNGLASLQVPNLQLNIGHVGLLHAVLERFHLGSRTTRLLLTNLDALHDRVNGKAVLLAKIENLLHIRANNSDFGVDANTSLNTEQMLDVLLDATQRGETMGGRTRQDIVRRLLSKRERASEQSQIIAAIDLLHEYYVINADPITAFSELDRLIGSDDQRAIALLSEWKRLIDLLHIYGVESDIIRLHPIHSRSWDYYTGAVFELTSGGYWVGGGGRYNQLVRLTDGRMVPAVGGVIDVDGVSQFISHRKENTWRVPVHIVYTPQTLPDAVQWAARLRKQGVAVALVDQPQRRNMLTISPDHDLIVGDHAFNAHQIDAALAAIATLPQESPLHDVK